MLETGEQLFPFLVSVPAREDSTLLLHTPRAFKTKHGFRVQFQRTGDSARRYVLLLMATSFSYPDPETAKFLVAVKTHKVSL